MNKRFFLALLLTGAVIVLTPLMFQDARRAPVSTQADSLTSPAVPPPAPVSPAAASNAPQVTPSPAKLDTTATLDTSMIITDKLRLRFVNRGAALVGAELTDYAILGSDSTKVELVRPGEALLRFHAVAGGDTIAIDRALFVATAEARQITYRGTVGNFPAEIRYSFAPDTYKVKIGKTEQPIGYIGRISVNISGAPPGTFLLVDLPAGFRSSETDSASDFSHLAYAFKPAAAGADLVRFGKVKPGEMSLQPGPLTWAVAKSKYFLVGVLADAAAPIAELKITGVPQTGRMATSGQATAVIPLTGGSASFETYIGPQDPRRLPAVGREFETANPYGGWMQGIVQPFARIVMKVLLWVKDGTGLNYGYTLIIFGILIRVVLWPLNQMAMRSSLRMQRVQPELAAAQKKWAKDPEKQRDEMMRIYREHGMSPLSPLSGCLPMLIPMPVLFALFFVFQNTIEFRGVGFWWMTDISQFDPLFIIPAAMVVSMFALQWIGMRNAPPNPQAKMMLYVLPIMMGVFLFKFAAGLNLYYAAQNLAALPQQWLIANERAQKMSGLETEQRSVGIASSQRPDVAAAFGDTIAAVATAPGRSAVATIRVSGSAAFAIGAACISPWPLIPRHATLVSLRSHDTQETIDQALATTFPGPRSFTGEDILEVSTHGGAITPSNVLRALVRAGARPAEPGEFTRRALLHGKIDLIQAEALGDLIDAPTSFVHRAALVQLSGALTRRITAIREALLELEALLAYDIDFPEEDEGPVPPARILTAAAQARAEIDTLLHTLPAARIAREGAVVVLAGLPNTGKSSLFNALIGEHRAIVTEHAGTTRDAIDTLIESEPYAFRLVDTAGLRETTDAIERLGVEVSTRWLSRADVVLVCGQTSASLRATGGAIGPTQANVIRVQTMRDLASDVDTDADVAVSAQTGEGIESLRALLSRTLVARYPLPAAETPVILRARHEAALTAARDELDAFSGAWTAGRLPPTVAAIHVRAAVSSLDGLIGAIDIEDVLSRLFERFCVGK